MQEALSPSSLASALNQLRERMGNSSDFIVREFADGPSAPPRMAVCYLTELVDQEQLSLLLDSLVAETRSDDDDAERIEADLRTRIRVGNVRRVHSSDEILAAVLAGEAAILSDGVAGAIAASVQGAPKRSIEEPSSQTVVRGPKEGFTEDLNVNLAQIRRRIRSPDLRVEERLVGRYTQTRVSAVYIEGIARPEVVEELRRRLDAIDIDSVLESGYIEEFIQDKSFTPFPTIQNTERPDTIAAHLLEGHVAVLVDGTPFALVLPVTFFKFFLSSEDYYQRYDIVSLVRIIRFISFFVSLLLPSLYVAITTFQQEMLPTTMLISLAAQREGVPLPALMEALLMELTFEVIREAGIRMPRVIGPAISIVGALVLGQAAVQAGLVSGAMVIIVSFTAIASFVIPSIAMSAAIRLVRFGLMFLAGTFGLFGILAGLVPLLVHMASLESFGVPYLMPVAPLRFRNFKDLVIRVPWRLMKSRPAVIGSRNPTRQADYRDKTGGR
ncbi:spore germination protein [Cohnella xylanilytica]|nr:spore germination protein [Cohnella xylanilytica]